jgi:hypothetical protein
MNSDQTLSTLAGTPVTTREICQLIDAELSDTDVDTSDLRLVLATDLLCDAALEVSAQLSGAPTISKRVSVDGSTVLPLADMAVVHALRGALDAGEVSQEMLQSLVIRSAVAAAISDALEKGATAESIASGAITLTPIRLSKLLQRSEKPKGLLAKLFDRS